MTETTNSDLMKVLLGIQDKQSRTEGLLDGFISEARANWARAQTDARAQDDRANAFESRLGVVEGENKRRQGKSEGHSLIGYVIAGMLSAGASITAIWSGWFHPPGH